MYYGLSSPKIFSNDTNDCNNLICIYKEFREKFLDKDTRPKLNGIFIYVENYELFGINKRFIHSVSIIDKYYYNSYPCINDISNTMCHNMCNAECDNNINCTRQMRRAICYYRLSRIHWVTEIIELANRKSDNIKVWSKVFLDKTTGQWNINKRFVWYKFGLANYIIIFEEKYRNGKLYCLSFITAYPVFGRRAEEGFLNDYNEYINKKPDLS